MCDNNITMEEWQKMYEQLDSADDATITTALADLKLKEENKGGSLDKMATDLLIPKCISHLDHHDIVIRCTAMGVLTYQLEQGNVHLLSHMPNWCKTLQQPNLLDLKSSHKDGHIYTSFHVYICNAVTIIQGRYPEILMPHFRPIGQYLVACTSSEHHHISTAACDYWSKLAFPPVPNELVEFWVSALVNKLGKLIPSLVNCLVYHKEHLSYLQRVVEDSTARDTPVDIEQYTNTRNFAALALEKVCHIFQTEATIIFKPILEKWLFKSDNWLETEAIILALATFTEGVGKPRQMKDLYPNILAKLLECYSHKQPLVRAITCFTMQQFINFEIKTMKDPFGKMLRRTLKLLKDNHPEVQEMATRSLAAILAYAERDISPHANQIIGTIIQANEHLKGQARNVYLECISHLFGRLGALITDKDSQDLMKPLIDKWKSLNWNNQSTTEEAMYICQPLIVVAMYGKSAFVPYNEEIFSKVMPYLENLVKDTTSWGDVRGEAAAIRDMVAYIDLLSAIFEGQQDEAASYVKDYNMVPVVIDILKNSKFKSDVHQSSLALLGHLVQHSYTQLNPHLDTVLDILDIFLNNNSHDILNNALWALSHIANQNQDRNDNLFKFSDKLVEILLKSDINEGTLINTALALTNLSRRWPGDLISKVTREDVFLQLSILLQRHFPRHLEKVKIFKNICEIMSGHTKKVSCDDWVQFCAAAAVLDSHDDQLEQILTSLLRDIRGTLGNVGWKRLNQKCGPQIAYALRKRYKLY